MGKRMIAGEGRKNFATPRTARKINPGGGPGRMGGGPAGRGGRLRRACGGPAFCKKLPGSRPRRDRMSPREGAWGKNTASPKKIPGHERKQGLGRWAPPNLEGLSGRSAGPTFHQFTIPTLVGPPPQTVTGKQSIGQIRQNFSRRLPAWRAFPRRASALGNQIFGARRATEHPENFPRAKGDYTKGGRIRDPFGSSTHRLLSIPARPCYGRWGAGIGRGNT